MTRSTTIAVRILEMTLCIVMHAGGGGILAALGQFYPELGGTLQNRLLCRERSTPSARIETRSWARVASARTL